MSNGIVCAWPADSLTTGEVRNTLLIRLLSILDQFYQTRPTEGRDLSDRCRLGTCLTTTATDTQDSLVDLSLSCIRLCLRLIGESWISLNTAVSNKWLENLAKSWLIVDSCTQYALNNLVHVSATTCVSSFQILKFFIRAWYTTQLTLRYNTKYWKFHRYDGKATTVTTTAILTNLGQPHRYGFQSSRFTLMSVTQPS